MPKPSQNPRRILIWSQKKPKTIALEKLKLFSEIWQMNFNGFYVGAEQIPGKVTFVTRKSVLTLSQAGNTFWSRFKLLSLLHFVPPLRSCNDARKLGRLVSSPL